MEKIHAPTEKPINELQEQITKVEERVGRGIIPPRGKELELSQMERAYPARYRHFVNVLLSIKNPKYSSENTDRSVKMLKVLDNLQDQLLRMESGVDKVLLPRQAVTFKKIASFLESGNTEGNITLPTGLGKTVIFSKLLGAAIKDTGIKVLVMGPTKVILNQNHWKLGEFGDIDAGSYFMHEKDLSKQVTVTTYASLRNGVGNGDIDPKQFDMLILDEAHRALGDMTVDAIDSFGDSVVKIGFTATPEFHEDKTVADILPVTIDNMGVREGIEDSLLAGLKVLLVKTKSDISKVERVGKEYDESSLSRIINTPERNDLIVDVYLNTPSLKGKLALVNCSGVDHTKDMTTAFKRKGVASAFIDGDTPDNEREILLEKFKNREILVLCNARVLIEGLDESEAEVCINAAPTMSKVVAEQRGGRVLRRSKEKDDKVGYVLEVIDEVGESENTQVLYSEIAGAAEIYNPEHANRRKMEEVERKTRVMKEKGEVDITASIVDDPDIIMKLTNHNVRQRFDKIFEYAPKMWAHSRRLAHELGVKEGSIRDYADIEKSKNPDAVKKYLSSTDILLSHYSPELSNAIRRHFKPELANTVTSQEYASQHVITPEKAEVLLSSIEVSSEEKGYHFDDTVYYPKDIYEKAVIEFEKDGRADEARIAAEAEDVFWNDDERTDEQREDDYWNSFEPIQTRRSNDLVGVDEGGDQESEDESEIRDAREVPFNDDDHEGNGAEIQKDYERKIVKGFLELLDPRERSIIVMHNFEEKTLKEIGEKYGLTKTRIAGIEFRALSKLRHPQRISRFDKPYETDEDAERVVRRRENEAERLRVNAIPLTIVLARYQEFKNRIAAEEKQQEYIASWERKYYDIVKIFEYSLLSTDRDSLAQYKPDENNSHLGSIVNSTGLKFVVEKVDEDLPEVSPDGKMLKLYDIYNIRTAMRNIESDLESAPKNANNVIEYYRNNKSSYSDWEKRIESQTLQLQRYMKELQARYDILNEYFVKYNQHFAPKKT